MPSFLAVLLSACAATAPNAPPALELPEAFLHADGWLAVSPQALTPGQAQKPAPDRWWQHYGDAQLNALITQVHAASPTLEQAVAQWRQALAAIDQVGAQQALQMSASADGSRSGNSGENAGPATRIGAGLTLSWMPDLWGRVALQQQAAQANANAAEANWLAVRLALELAAAEQYVNLQLLQLDARLLAQTLASYERSLQLTQNQYEAGLVARADVIQAEIQRESVMAQIAGNRRGYALSVNALAVLAGSTPASWQAPQAKEALGEAPHIPRQVTSKSLTRRPDVAAAAQQLAAANAQLGVTQAAWLPDLSLLATGGLQADGWSQFINAPLRAWSVGPALAASLFDGGSRRAATAQAQASYDEQAAAWRQSVLQAVREVEDALANNQWLRSEHQHQITLLDLANDNLRVVQNQYEAGFISFLEVAIAQNTALTTQRNVLQLQAQRLQASMQLVAALGGSW